MEEVQIMTKTYMSYIDRNGVMMEADTTMISIDGIPMLDGTNASEGSNAGNTPRGE